MTLETADSNKSNSAEYCCAGTVQDNCANFSQFGCYRYFRHEEPRVSPLLPEVNLCPCAMSVPAAHTANGK